MQVPKEPPRFEVRRTASGGSWYAHMHYGDIDWPTAPRLTRWGARMVGRRTVARVLREEAAWAPSRAALDALLSAAPGSEEWREMYREYRRRLDEDKRRHVAAL